MVCLPLPCTYHAPKLKLPLKGPKGGSTWPRHLGVPSGASKMISEDMVRLVQTVDLPCTETKTISKWTEMRFYMTHVTKEFHRVRPKWFLSLWYIEHKPCTYLESRLELSPNEPKRVSIWASSPRISIRCIQNDFWGHGTFGANCGSILHQ
jgi:hypothetical protein